MGIDTELTRHRIVLALPQRVRWMIHGTPLDFDFSRAQHPLREIEDRDLNGCDIPEEWTVLRLFGDEDYAEGGGASPFLGVHVETGEIYGLDVERDSAEMFLLNSNVETFIATFQLFDRALRERTLPPGEIASRAEALDPASFRVGEWSDLADYIASDQESDEDEPE